MCRKQLFSGKFFGNQSFLDGICVNGVINLSKGTLQVPVKLLAVVFVFFEALESLNDVEFKLHRYPRSKRKSNVFVRKCAAVTPRFRKIPMALTVSIQRFGG